MVEIWRAHDHGVDAVIVEEVSVVAQELDGFAAGDWLISYKVRQRLRGCVNSLHGQRAESRNL